MRIDGIKSKYYDLLLTPLDDPYFTSTLTLIFHRVIHLFKHGEWITDAKLVSKFKAHLKTNPQITLKHKVIVQAFRTRLGNTHQLNDIKIEPLFSSPFSVELWGFARDGINSATLDEKIFTSKGLSREQEAYLHKARIEILANNTAETQQKLLDTLEKIEAEMGITKQIQDLLKDMILRIQTGGCPKKLMLDLRLVREYLMLRCPTMAKAGPCGTGYMNDVSQILRGCLFPGPHLLPTFQFSPVKVQGDVIYFPSVTRVKNETPPYKFSDAWATAFFLADRGHIASFIFNGKGYQKLDNLYPGKPLLTASEMYQHLKDVNFDPNSRAHVMPLGKGSPPNVDKWSTPLWERNNCFLAVSLMYLATIDHYQKSS